MKITGVVIAFDFGTRNIGVAIGQLITYTCRPLISINSRNGIVNWQGIERLISEWQPEIAIVGLPLNMDGTEQPFTYCVRKFANRLHDRFGIKVILHDERLSTADARMYLFARSGFRALKTNKINAWSAAVILESWLGQISKSK